MSFTFGAPAPSGGGGAPAPAPPAAGGFSFGAAAPAPTTAAPAVGAPAPPAPAGGFSFGANAPAASPTGNTPAPGAPASGFSFGGAAPAAPTPGAAPAATGPAPSTAPAPSGGFSFGAPPPAPAGSSLGAAAPAPSLFGGAPAATAPPPPAAPPGLTVPDYDKHFPYQFIYTKVSDLIKRADTDSLAGQELVYLLQTTASDTTIGKDLVKPELPAGATPNHSVRQQLAQRPTVLLYGKEATLTVEMLKQVFALSDELRISETDALCLYAQARRTGTAPTVLYWEERSKCMETILMLLHHRVGVPVHSSGSHYEPSQLVLATDQLLQSGWISNLIQLVRQATTRLDQLKAEGAKLQATAAPGTTPTVPESYQAHWNYTVTTRQAATEALYFCAYQTQMTLKEVEDLVDLVKDLSNAMPVQNPYTDVPAAFAAAATSTTNWMMPPAFANNSTGAEKEPLKWQDELIQETWKSGQPDLLRAVGTLLMALHCALDTKVILMDRQTHSPNGFTGNALLPPRSTSLEGLGQLSNKLGTVDREWKRLDVLGFAMASFALLVRCCPAGSPRRAASHDGLKAASAHQSFSLARLALVPALQRPGKSREVCHVSEFLWSTLTQWTSSILHILGSDLPSSRAAWLQDQEEDLKLRRDHSEQQRQFQQWSGTSASLEPVPSVVDLMQRPDCLDDVVALVSALCSLGPDYALRFWHEKEENDDDWVWTPTRALPALEAKLNNDETLQPCYLSLLGALAVARTDSWQGADAIHEWLLQRNGWSSLLQILRFYVRQFDTSYGAGGSSQSTSTSTSATASSSTAYYYFDRDTGGVGSDQNSSEDASSSPSRKPQELGDYNEFNLLSHLRVLSVVVRQCPAARLHVLDLTVPIVQENGETIGQDTTLMILFSLAVLPLGLDARGAVFSAVADLLRIRDLTTTEEMTKVRQAAGRAWDLLESSQILPIYLLDQFPTQADSRNILGLAFPPSSTAMISTSSTKSWIPADPRYAILYEMEYIESAVGRYPSTEGFLRLLNALFVAGGSPVTLGENWRSRPGAAPYLEFVVHLVLPRVTGQFSGTGRLPFRCSQDENRLTCLAVEVVQTVISRTILPDGPHLEGTKEEIGKRLQSTCLAAAKKQLGHPALAKAVVVMPEAEEEILHFARDFQTKKSSLSLEQTSALSTSSTPTRSGWTSAPTPQNSNIPAAKGPGATALAAVLSTAGSSLIHALVDILVRKQSWRQADQYAMAQAVFVTTPPTFVSAKEGSRRSLQSHQTLIKPLTPTADCPSYEQAKESRERALVATLMVLCATAAREEILRRSLEEADLHLSVVPVVVFRKQSAGAPSLKYDEIHNPSLSEILLSSNYRTGVLTSLVGLIGDLDLSEDLAMPVVTSATALLFYVDRSLRPRQGVNGVLGAQGSQWMASCFAERIVATTKLPLDGAHQQFLAFVFDHIVSDLRKDPVASDTLSQALLGLSVGHTLSSWSPQTALPSCPVSCLDAIVHILTAEFTVASESSALASSCFEIVYRLCRPPKSAQDEIRLALYSAERLRSSRFWERQLMALPTVLRQIEVCRVAALESTDLLHSSAWLLKGVAEELQRLAGAVGPPSPTRYQALVTLLLEAPHNLVFHIVTALPVERIGFETIASVPTEEAVRQAKRSLVGAPEIVGGYSLVDETKVVEVMKSKDVNAKETELVSWATQWNRFTRTDCASAHLSDAVHTLLGGVEITSKALGHYSKFSFSWGNVLEALLDRITTAEEAAGTYPRLDEKFFTTATRNVALACLVATQAWGRERSGSGDTIIACSGLGRAIICSEPGGGGGQSSARPHERTAILASAFANMLKAVSIEELARVDRGLLYSAAVTLARSSAHAESSYPVKPSPVALASRSCLCLLLGICDTGDKDSDDSFLRAVLTDTGQSSSGTSIIGSMIALLPVLDDDIAVLLQRIATLARGGDYLVEAGALEALQRAATNYKAEESRFLLSQTERLNSEQVHLMTPSFLMGHLQLLNALLATPANPQRRKETAAMSVSIIGTYSPVIRRLLSAFPLDGDVVQSVLQCIAAAQAVLRDEEHSGMQALMPIDIADLENDVARLTMHLAENPLPPGLLSSTPSIAATSKSQGALETATTTRPSWWEGARESSVNGVEDIAMIGLLGAKMLCTGLRFVRGSAVVSSIDGNSLAHALLRCTNAIKMIAARHEATSTTWIGEPAMDSEVSQQLKDFASKLSDAIAELLVIILVRLRGMKNELASLDTAIPQLRKAMSFALNSCGLDTSGIDTTPTNENQKQLVLDLAQAIRKELNQNQGVVTYS